MTDDSPDISDIISGKVAPWFREAAGEVGVSEWDLGWNPEIKKYTDSTDVGFEFKDDGEGNPWCAAFVNWAMEQSGQQGVPGYGGARAGAWGQWGTRDKNPGLGTVGVKSSGGQNHVGIVVGTTPSGDVVLLGGNQGNAVNMSVYPKGQFTNYRSPSGTGGYPQTTIGNTQGLPRSGGTR